MYKLPKNWCIKQNNNHLEIGEWFDKNKTNAFGGTYNNDKKGYYLHYPADRQNNHASSKKLEDWTEITPEQFKQWVLKETITYEIY